MLHYFAKTFFAPILASGMVQDKQLFVYTITDVQDLQNCKLRINVHRWDTLDKPAHTVTTQAFNQVRFKHRVDCFQIQQPCTLRGISLVFQMGVLSRYTMYVLVINNKIKLCPSVPMFAKFRFM